MALQIWLPLDGSLRNLGLSQGTITQLDTVSYQNTGKVLNKAMNAGRITIDKSAIYPWLNETDSWTTCIWFNNLGKTQNHSLFGFSGNGDLGGSARAWDFFIYSNKNNLHFSSGNLNSNAPTTQLENVFTDNKWYWLCFIKDGLKISLIINNTVLVSWTIDSSKNSINKNQNYGINATGCAVQDFRFYDHALSAREREEIYKGLCIHLTMEANTHSYPNLIKNGRFNSNANWSNWGSSTTRTFNTTYLGKQCCHLVTTAAKFNGVSQCLGTGLSPITPGITYKFSFDAVSPSSTKMGFGFHWNKGSGTIVNQSWWNDRQLTNTWQHYSFNVTPSGTDVTFFNLMIGNGGTDIATDVYLTNLKFELGTVETPFCPHMSEVGGESFFDSSGYAHSVSKSAEGNFSYVKDTPRYLTATYMPNRRLTIADGFPNETNNPFTISMWLRPKSGYTVGTYSDIWGFSYTGGYGDTQCRLEINSNTSSYTIYRGMYPTSGGAGVPLAVDTWQHFVFTNDGTSAKIYINNVLKHSYTIVDNGLTFKPSGPFWIGDGGNVYFDISDVRVYASCLSIAQITELYNTSMIVDTSGNILPRTLS